VPGEHVRHRGSGPHETLTWARRIEIVTGLGSAGWLLASRHGRKDGGIGCSSQRYRRGWGRGQILRRAHQRPEILQHDRDRGYRRARQWALIGTPAFVIFGGAVAYAYGQWLGAAINVLLLGLGAGLGSWWTLKQLR
jgi:hypothetical protein